MVYKIPQEACRSETKKLIVFRRPVAFPYFLVSCLKQEVHFVQLFQFHQELKFSH